MKKIILSFISVAILSFSQAQNVTEAYQLNTIENFGTARSMGLSGAFNGLGADLSSSHFNPANSANFSKSQFSFTPYLNMTHSLSPDGGYLNTKSNLAFSNLSFAGVIGNNVWSFHYQREADFHQKLSDNYNGSLLNHWENQAISTDATNINELDQFYPTGAGLAYHAFLLNLDTTLGQFYAIDNTTANQSRTTTKRGRSNVYSLGFAHKLNKLLNLGASLNMPTFSYTEVSNYSESDFDPATDHLGLQVTDEYEVSGRGVNLKIGVNVKPIKPLRFSIAYQTPSIMWMQQSYETTITSDHAIWEEFTANQPGIFDYYYIKPQRLDVGIGIIPNRFIALGIDYTFQDNAQSRFVANNSSYTLDAINQNIQNELVEMHQLRAGIEGRLNNFYLRAGASYTSDSYQSSEEFSGINGASIGFGINKDNYRFDLALQNLQRYERVYDFAPTETSTRRKINETKIAATWTWRF